MTNTEKVGLYVQAKFHFILYISFQHCLNSLLKKPTCWKLQKKYNYNVTRVINGTNVRLL